MKQFLRVCRLVVVRDGQPIVDVDGLRVRFRVQAYPLPMGSNAAITVYNLTAHHRAVLARPLQIADLPVAPPYDTVFLGCSYNGQSPPVIHRGVIFTAVSQRAQTDWTTDITSYGWLTQTVGATLDKAYKNQTYREVLNDLLALTGYGLAKVDSGSSIKLDTVFNTYAVRGSAGKALVSLLSGRGIIASEKGNGLSLVSETSSDISSVPTPDMPLLSPTTGLIGTPKITKQGVQARTLLNPSLAVFEPFAVSSATTELATDAKVASYMAKSVVHVGDTHGQEWYTDVEGVYPQLYRKSTETITPETPAQAPQ